MGAKKVLLTGGSGFIGRNIQESFLKDKYQIFSPRHHDLDLVDDESVRRYFLKHGPFDRVIHSAVKPGHRNAKNRESLLVHNTRMFFNLERHRDLWEKMIVLGSGAIYGMNQPISKATEKNVGKNMPVDEHGLGKYILQKYIDSSKNILTLHIFSIFGKYEDYAIRFISNLLCKSLFDLPLTMRQDRLFDFLDVGDLMPVLDHFLESWPDKTAYNTTPDSMVSLKDTAFLIRDIAQKPHLPVICSKKGQGMDYGGDNTLLKREIPSWKPTPLRDSIEKLYFWYQTHQNEIDRNVLLFDR